MGTDFQIESLADGLTEDDKRLLGQIARLLAERHSSTGSPDGHEDDLWNLTALQALLRDTDHPDEIDYALSDAKEIFPK
ncbi:MAG: hypothetical protein IT350_13345 [Deltaproteobacteria bacterium]|nr:hypothetical protein [Deltaproteobacteria bacterium]